MKKTKEELRAAANRRATKKKALRNTFPFARLERFWDDNHKGLVIQLEPGEPQWLTVRYRGEAFIKAAAWQESNIHLGDPQQLIEFIAALCARYNAMIEELNSTAAKVALVTGDSVTVK